MQAQSIEIRSPSSIFGTTTWATLGDIVDGEQCVGHTTATRLGITDGPNKLPIRKLISLCNLRIDCTITYSLTKVNRPPSHKRAEQTGNHGFNPHFAMGYHKIWTALIVKSVLALAQTETVVCVSKSGSKQINETDLSSLVYRPLLCCPWSSRPISW